MMFFRMFSKLKRIVLKVVVQCVLSLPAEIVLAKKNKKYYYLISLEDADCNLYTMQFALDNSRISKKFIYLIYMSKLIGLGCILPETTNISMSLDKDDVEIKISQLNHHIEIFNLLQVQNKKRLRFPSFTPSGNALQDQQALNKLHAFFESWSGRYTSQKSTYAGYNEIPEAEFHLNRINNIIHMIEKKLPSFYGEDCSLSARVSYTTNGIKVKNTKSWHKCFTTDIQFGDLLMNYSTKGKTLWHLFIDNDIQHLESGGSPTPQEALNTGILAWFSSPPVSIYTKTREHSTYLVPDKMILEWIEFYSLSDRFSISNSPDQCNGYIKLGSFLPTYPLDQSSTESEIINHYSKCTRITNYSVISK